MKEALRKQKKQEAFTNWLASKWGLTYKEAFKKQCTLSYEEAKTLCKEWENETN